MNQDFKYIWSIKDGYPPSFIEDHKSKVFSTFACGGGSTMGYKLAGFEVIGANDIDTQMAKVYKYNHNPKYYFLESITELVKRDDLPKELFNLDILDGSPPCSTFSMAGSREDSWKKDKKFREGQSKQVLSDLFFDWIRLVEKLQPKIAIAENVKGMLMGNAKAYTQAVIKELDKIGYNVQLFLLNAATMGVPQKRERVFFICLRKDIKLPKLKLNFTSKPITFKEATYGLKNQIRKPITENMAKYYEKCKPGNSFSSVHTKGSYFNSIRLSENKTCNTLTALNNFYHPTIAGKLTDKEYEIIGSFPTDYNYLDIQPTYLIGMSVPPVMMAQIAYQIYLQWLQYV